VQDGRRRQRCSRFAPPLAGPCASVALCACRGARAACSLDSELMCSADRYSFAAHTLARIQTIRALQLASGAFVSSTRFCASASASAASCSGSNLHASFKRTKNQPTNKRRSIGWVAAHRHRQRAWRPCSLWFQRKEAAAREDTRHPRPSRLRDGTTHRRRSSRSKSHNTRRQQSNHRMH
jgi:hypothetical protein